MTTSPLPWQLHPDTDDIAGAIIDADRCRVATGRTRNLRLVLDTVTGQAIEPQAWSVEVEGDGTAILFTPDWAGKIVATFDRATDAHHVLAVNNRLGQRPDGVPWTVRVTDITTIRNAKGRIVAATLPGDDSRLNHLHTLCEAANTGTWPEHTHTWVFNPSGVMPSITDADGNVLAMFLRPGHITGLQATHPRSPR